jgi:hypothetical protein
MDSELITNDDIKPKKSKFENQKVSDITEGNEDMSAKAQEV